MALATKCQALPSADPNDFAGVPVAGAFLPVASGGRVPLPRRLGEQMLHRGDQPFAPAPGGLDAQPLETPGNVGQGGRAQGLGRQSDNGDQIVTIKQPIKNRHHLIA